METRKRTHIVVPEELIIEIDRLFGKRKVRETAGTWENDIHPELNSGSDKWVKTLREEDKKRLEELD